ncbi:putative glutamate decarboxylase [Protomyces lactucae-debilis]|uniref:Glutamate decarboxylase n=1 Tax=Protomyces lactucae-debilis TaxID=2754530 RepID=A0A1Y2FSZ1_PROLT|nr:putative glutamate decarboxylase [Protomyces lactucae-debilis]ORY87112.1 putative glutamate decarboxylase [Protomyces lactucae-debilis]
MVLHKHVDADEVLKVARGNRAQQVLAESNNVLSTPYSGRYEAFEDLPKWKIPQGSSPAAACYQLIHDELDFDGRTNLNLASFVHTYMEPEADKLMVENIAKNLSDMDEYPAMLDMQARCVSMISGLWHGPPGKAFGTATIGSSEAIMLAGLAAKKRWQKRQEAAGKSTAKPSCIMGSNAQVAIEKFARYFEVENRLIPVCKESCYVLDINKIKEQLDETTIAVFVILGSTYTGTYENVQAVSDLLDEYEKETGISIPIHVDAASGGFVAPFVTPEHVWDFQIPRVKSINTSGHKYGLVYAGLGWLIFRDEDQLPKELVFELHYLGSTQESYTLNFSRGGATVIAQYYNFLRLGFEGYKQIGLADLENARVLSVALEATGYFECVSDVHRKKGEFLYNTKALSDGSEKVAGDVDPGDFNPALPVVAFRLTDEFSKKYPHVKQAAISTFMRVKQWITPNYSLPPTADKVEVLRVVVRESFHTALLDRFVKDVIETVETLIESDTVDLNAFAGSIDAAQGSAKQPGHKGKKAGTEEYKQHHKHHKNFYRRAC